MYKKIILKNHAGHERFMGRIDGRGERQGIQIKFNLLI
jgi:hypothetical protein